MITLLFLSALSILLLEGWLIAGLLVPSRAHPLRFALALPLAALAHVLLTLSFTIVHIPLSVLPYALGHAAIIAAAWAALRRLIAPAPGMRLPHSPVSRPLALICVILLSGQLLYVFTHAVLLPTVQIDSLTNWTMRSKASFLDRAIAFDHDEARGVAKPQYPFLFHALQVAANQGQPRWNDRIANAITFLLTVGQLTSLFLLLSLIVGASYALLITTVIAGIPLLSFHLAQGYADIHLVGYLLLSLVSLMLWQKTRSLRMLALSAAMVGAAVWTKFEGLFVGLLPWLLLCGLVAWSDGERRIRPVAVIAAAAVLTSLLFPLLLLLQGLPLTPHGMDAVLRWQPEAFPRILSGLSADGSSGITWYALVACVALLWRNRNAIERSFIITLLWGLIALTGILFTYAFTPNVQFLLNAESFHRQLMIPETLLMLSCFVMLQPLLRKR